MLLTQFWGECSSPAAGTAFLRQQMRPRRGWSARTSSSSALLTISLVRSLVLWFRWGVFTLPRRKRDDNARCLLANEAGVACLAAISAKIENGALQRGRRALARFSRLTRFVVRCAFLAGQLLVSIAWSSVFWATNVVRTQCIHSSATNQVLSYSAFKMSEKRWNFDKFSIQRSDLLSE